MRTVLPVILLVLAGCSAPPTDVPEFVPPEPPNVVLPASAIGIGYGASAYSGAEFWAAAEAVDLVTWTGLISDLATPNGVPHRVAREAAERGIAFGMIVSPFYQDSPGFAVQFDNEGQRAWRDALVTFLNDHQVAWLGVGLEVNYWRELTEPGDYAVFVAWYDGLSRNLDAAHPSLAVFPVFQYELLLGLHGGLWGGSNGAGADWSILADFPNRDALGFTMYPSLVTSHPRDLGAGYWENLSRGEPVAIVETAWHAAGHDLGELDGTPAKQTAWAHAVRNHTDAWTVSWTYGFDQPAPAPFTSMGLHDGNGTARPAWNAWHP